MSLKIVFMGTPGFAVPSLSILVDNGYDVVGVITATDKMGGRGNKTLLESDVKKYAISKGLRVLQPKNLKAPEFVEELRSLNADIQVVVAFRMLPEVVWNMPRLGTMNLHGSILPKYRGAAPINWAVIKGEKETGVTTFFLQHAIDTGDILMMEKLPIGPDETVGEVHDRMMVLGAETILKSIQKVETGNYDLIPQNHGEATKAPKIFTETCEINFNQSVHDVHNFIRGLSPYPAAWMLLDGIKLKIYRSHKIEAVHHLEPGKFISDNKSYLRFVCKDGFIEVLELQLQGKKRMPIKAFLNGYSFS